MVAPSVAEMRKTKLVKKPTPILSNKLKVKCPDAASFTIVVMAKEDTKPAVQVTQTKTIPIPVPGAEMSVNLFTDLVWNTPPRAEAGITYVANVIALGTCAAEESAMAAREFAVTGKDVAKWKKATSPAPADAPKLPPADTSAPTATEKADKKADEKPAPTPAPASGSPAPTPAPATKVYKFPVTYWDLKNRMGKTMKNRLKELQDSGNTEFWVESEELVFAFHALTADKKMPSVEEVKEIREKVENLITRMHVKCEEIRAIKRAENTVAALKVPTIQNLPPAPAPVTIPAEKLAANDTDANANAGKKATGANTPAPAPKAPAPTAAQKPAPAPAPAPVKNHNTPAATTTTTVKVEPIEVVVKVVMPTPPPAPLPPTPPTPPAPPADTSAPAKTPPSDEKKMTWVDWLIWGLIIAALISAGIWWACSTKKSATPVAKATVANATTGITTNVITVNNTNGNTSVQVVKTTDDKSPISVSGAISVGNGNTGSVIGVQNNNQTYNYYYGDKKSEKVVGRGAVNNDAIDKDKDEQTGSAEKVLRIPSWKPWPKVDCSLLVVVPRPEVVNGEVSKTVYLEDGQTAVLDTPYGCHYEVKEMRSLNALEGIDEFCHAYVAGLQYPEAVKARDRQAGKTPVWQLWLTPKNGKAMALHIKLIRDHD